MKKDAYKVWIETEKELEKNITTLYICHPYSSYATGMKIINFDKEIPIIIKVLQEALDRNKNE